VINVPSKSSEVSRFFSLKDKNRNGVVKVWCGLGPGVAVLTEVRQGAVDRAQCRRTGCGLRMGPRLGQGSCRDGTGIVGEGYCCKRNTGWVYYMVYLVDWSAEWRWFELWKGVLVRERTGP
jgi:hypothetical protein